MAPVLLRDEATGQREKIAETWYLTSTPAAHFIHRTFLRVEYILYVTVMFGAHVNGKHSICENGTDATRANPRCDIR
jgi:hypothetical protein